MIREEKKMNVKLENNKENQNSSKHKVKDEKEQCKYKKRCLKYIFFLLLLIIIEFSLDCKKVNISPLLNELEKKYKAEEITV